MLIDPYGRPLKVDAKTMGSEIAVPSTGARRPATFDSVVTGLEPVRLARILDAAVHDDASEFFALAEEIEERDLHYGSVLQTRKDAVSNLEPQIEAVDDTAEEEEIAKFCRSFVERAEFADMLDDALDALGKGVSVVEMVWETGKRWVPREFEWRDQRFFAFDKETRRELLLKSGDERLPLPWGKYVTHAGRVKTGLPIRAGLARFAAWAFIMKSYTLKDWAGFCEVFGQPLRVGRYERNATAEEKRALLRTVLSIAGDAGGIIPKGMEIEFIKSEAGRGEAVFGKFADYLDKQVSKRVLGQTMTTDDGASLAQAKVHDEVRDDIRRADVRRLQATIQRDVILPAVQLNFGVRQSYPQFKLFIEEPEDIKALSDATAPLVRAGLRVSQRQVRARLGYDEPEEDDEVLVPPGTAPEPRAARNTRHGPGCPCCRASNADRGDPGAAEIEAIGEEELDAWKAQIAPIADPIERLLRETNSYEEFLAQLDDVLDEVDLDEVTKRLATAMAKARIRGMADG